MAGRGSWGAVLLLCALPALLAGLVIAGPIVTDPVVVFGGIAHGARPGWLPGFPTIDPNIGFTSYALGVRAALDLLAGRLPLWNPYEGLGTPLLGEMQAAALFPPTLLLLLPHGQVIEQAALQVVAGIGTFLFLRRFGLGVAGALAGGVLFEFNGVMALLRNAIFNPVAFLPWLFWLAESLFAAAGLPLWQRRRTIALGAVAAALAVYAGFPELVYYYCLPLLAWVAFRATCLGGRAAGAYLLDLLITAGLALLLAAPVLLAFGHFLLEAELGAHEAGAFRDAVQAPHAAIAYLLPYLYGPISHTPDPRAAAVWSHGSYVGMAPFLLALGAVASGWRRPAVSVLALYAAAAVAVSHGVPILIDGFRHVPLMTMAAFSRYLDAGWVFCVAVLAAMFVDRAVSGPRRVGLVAVVAGVVLLAAGLALAGPVIAALWHAKQGYRGYLLASAAVAGLVVAGIAAALGLPPRRRQAALVTIAGAEAMLLFAIPFASYPRAGRADSALVAFLQQHVGLGRMAIASGNGLSPNFGSALGIASINYDDLPVPQRLADYVRTRLSPTADPIMFRPNATFRHETVAVRRRAFLDHLPGYRAAGVTYFLAEPDFFAVPASAWREAPARPVPLGAGGAIAVTAPRPEGLESVATMLVTLGTYGGRADGTLEALLCQEDRCARAEAALETAPDNGDLRLQFAAPFAMGDGPFRLTLSKRGGSHDVALWAKPAAAADGDVPQVRFVAADAPAPVVVTPTNAVFALEGARPYASAPDCRITAATRERMTADCDRASRLLRLETFMHGWVARVNGQPVRIDPAEDTFQSIELPAGRSDVTFAYDPAGVRPSAWVAGATLLGLLLAMLPGRAAASPRHSPHESGRDAG